MCIRDSNVVVQNEIQADIYHKVIDTDWESLHEFRSGDLLNRLSDAVSQVASSVLGWIPSPVSYTHLTVFFCVSGI